MRAQVAPNFKFSAAPNPARGAYSAPPDPLAGGEGVAAPSLRTPPPLSASSWPPHFEISSAATDPSINRSRLMKLPSKLIESDVLELNQGDINALGLYHQAPEEFRICYIFVSHLFSINASTSLLRIRAGHQGFPAIL